MLEIGTSIFLLDEEEHKIFSGDAGNDGKYSKYSKNSKYSSFFFMLSFFLILS